MSGGGSAVRRWLHRFVPSQFEDPFGLAGRLIRSKDRAAYFAMASAGLGVAVTPLDLALAALERRRYRSAPDPRWPIVLVCGPARSGTTLVAQTLIHSLPVGFFTNLTSIFPRAPLTATRLFRGLVRPPAREFRSYYGKTRGWGAPNDALYLWDRWLGAARNRPVEAIGPAESLAMRRFFGAAEALADRPLVAKNNNLVGAAGPVAAALPTARFICLERHPVYLAQALLVARRDIHGGEDAPYGLTDGAGPADPIDNVCHQVRLVTELGRRAAAALGPERFRLVSYERFCADPGALVRDVATDLERATGRRIEVPRLDPFQASSRSKLDPAILARFQAALGDLVPPA